MVRVRIPATSANLGAGFDSLGLAVNLYNYVDMEESDGVFISSTDGTWVPTTKENLIYQSAQRLYDECGKKLCGLRIIQQNNIPMTRGLGSSSACIVGGLAAANQMLGNPLGLDDMVGLASDIEGHPDNTTPALLGGIVTAVLEEGKVFWVKQEVHSALRLIAVIPDLNSARKWRGRSSLKKSATWMRDIICPARRFFRRHCYRGNTRISGLPWRTGFISHIV